MQLSDSKNPLGWLLFFVLVSLMVFISCVSFLSANALVHSAQETLGEDARSGWTWLFTLLPSVAVPVFVSFVGLYGPLHDGYGRILKEAAYSWSDDPRLKQLIALSISVCATTAFLTTIMVIGFHERIVGALGSPDELLLSVGPLRGFHDASAMYLASAIESVAQWVGQ